MERSKTEWAGVAAGSKMLVGDCTKVVWVEKNMLHTAARAWEARVRPLFTRVNAVVDVASKWQVEVDLPRAALIFEDAG